MQMRRFRGLLALLLAFAMLAAACGSSDDSSGDTASDDSPTTTQAEEPEEIPATIADTAAPEAAEEEEPEEEDVDSGPVSGGTVVLATQVQATSINSNIQSGNASGSPSSQLFASPILFDGDYNPEPYLAESWSFSDDGLQFTLNLVEGATFHDGEPIKASDVAFSINMNKEFHPFKPMFGPVESIDTPDDQTVILNLSQPHPAILIAMSPALLPVMPEHVYGEAVADGTIREFAGNIDPDVFVGSGPFKLDEFDPSNGIIRMSRNDDFFLGAPYIDELVIQTIQDPNTTIIALENGEVHSANLQGVADVERAQGLDGIVVTPEGTEGIGAVVSMEYNLEDEVLSDVRVRQAIAYSLDKDFIVNTLHGGLPFRAKSPIHPGSPFYDDSMEAYDFDQARAAELFDEAGYPADGDGNRGISLTIDFIPGVPDYQKNVAEYIKSALSEVGVEIEIRSSPDIGTWIGYLAPRDYDLTMNILFMWADPVIGVHRSFLEANIQPIPFANNSAYINADLEAKLSEAAVELDVAARTALYAEIQATLAEDLPFHWIETLPTHSVYTESLQNPPLTIWGAMSPMHEAWLAE